MKKTPFKRKTPLKAKTGFKALQKPLKRSRLHVKGHSTVSELKDEIQALLRQLVMKRDKKCVLYGIKCYNEVGVDDEGVVWQAEHLEERSNSETYADSRLVVLVCKNCHGWKHFKKSNHDQYDEWVRTKLEPERVALWDRCKANRWRPKHTGSYDWKLQKLALEQELKKYG